MTEKANRSGNAVLVAIWAAALLVVFTAFRFDDILKLPSLVGNLGGGPLFGSGIADSFAAVVAALVIGFSWFCLGSFIYSFIPASDDRASSFEMDIAKKAALGAAAFSLVWFFLGLAGLYNSIAASFSVLFGFLAGVYAFTRKKGTKASLQDDGDRSPFIIVLKVLIAVPLLLSLISSLAPPTAKDTLLYHFSVPKQFIAQGGNAFIEGNIASYLALGTEMHVVWARLLGGFISERAAEAAGGAVLWLFFPLLLAAVYGWAREEGISKPWSLLATALVACIPTAYHVAASGYVDLALSLFVVLAAHSLLNWLWTGSTRSAILLGIFLGAALSIKLTTVFVIAAFVLIVLLRARQNKDGQAGSLRSGGAGRFVLTGFGALLLAGLIASPWYLRTWAETGSPVFPFYMSILPGEAPGWDVERSNLFQGMNSQYGGVQTHPENYLIAPLRISLAAQPEDANLYDGVIGAMFIIGLPLVLWAAWKRELADGVGSLLIVVGVVYLFWLFSSQQLRYLLPIMPLLAIAIASAADKLKDGAMRNAWKYSLTAASFIAVLTALAWFSMKAPLRVAFGGETTGVYLTRNLDHYSYYSWLNSESGGDEKTWLINMRRDTYHIERPIFSDYIFEDWTLRKMVWDARSAEDLRQRTREMGVNYVLARHDFLFNYDRTTLVDDRKPRPENEAKLKIAKEFLLDPARTIRADEKFSLIRIDK